MFGSRTFSSGSLPLLLGNTELEENTKGRNKEERGGNGYYLVFYTLFAVIGNRDMGVHPINVYNTEKK